MDDVRFVIRNIEYMAKVEHELYDAIQYAKSEIKETYEKNVKFAVFNLSVTERFALNMKQSRNNGYLLSIRDGFNVDFSGIN
jgi:hypothetical protein